MDLYRESEASTKAGTIVQMATCLIVIMKLGVLVGLYLSSHLEALLEMPGHLGAENSSQSLVQKAVDGQNV